MIAHYRSMPTTAMAIFAHPDDAEVACGGTLGVWAERGSQIVLVVGTSGDKGTPFGHERSLAEVRALEMIQAADLLAIADVIRLPYDDGEIENSLELRGRLVSLIRRFRPEVVICPDPTAIFFGDSYYNHRDHRQLGWAVLDSIFPAAKQSGYFPDAGAVHEVSEVLLAATLDPNTAVAIEGMVERKITAIGIHRSQIEAMGELVGDTVRLRALESGRLAGISAAAELFRVVRGG
ncbi:MAG: PIG-L deacetylase family protein [Ferrimicrobium sp.]